MVWMTVLAIGWEMNLGKPGMEILEMWANRAYAGRPFAPMGQMSRAACFLRAFFLALLVGLAAGCAPGIAPPAPSGQAPVPAGFPEAYYRQAEASGRKVLRIDPDNSLVVVEVRRSGPLARLGHDHVVASHDLRGYVDIEGGRSDLYVPLDQLAVDEPALRAEAGLATAPTKEAVEGTRHNMLEKVLESGRYPFALIRISRVAPDRPTLDVAITLHGTVRTFEIPARIETLPGGIVVSGRITFNQTDFGMAPFSVLGGALQVQDRLDLRFRVQAKGG